MARGYWIARVDVTDMEGYQAYVKAIAKPLARYGAKYVTRGGIYEAVEGASRARNVTIEFASYADALACYRSDDYQAAIPLRQSSSDSELVIVEGYDGPQLGETA